MSKLPSPSMDAWLREAKQHESAPKIGMYLTHNGVVRRSAKAKVRFGDETAADVQGMTFGYDKAKVDAVIADTYRMEGIHSRLAEAGLEKNLTVMLANREQEIEDSAFEYDSGYRLTNALLDEHKDITAIIAVNDTTAAGCITALHERKIRIPDEIAVCGFDNLLIGRICAPTLTTVDQMASHASKVGLDMLMEKINHPHMNAYPINVEYRPHLVIREST